MCQLFIGSCNIFFYIIRFINIEDQNSSFPLNLNQISIFLQVQTSQISLEICSKKLRIDKNKKGVKNISKCVKEGTILL